MEEYECKLGIKVGLVEVFVGVANDEESERVVGVPSKEVEC